MTITHCRSRYGASMTEALGSSPDTAFPIITGMAGTATVIDMPAAQRGSSIRRG